jgi:epoxyqueuosine reductase QueG
MDEIAALKSIITNITAALRPTETLARGLGDALAATDLSSDTRAVVAAAYTEANDRRTALRTRLANLQDVLDTVNLYEPIPIQAASAAVRAELAHHLAAAQAAAGLFVVDPT